MSHPHKCAAPLVSWLAGLAIAVCAPACARVSTAPPTPGGRADAAVSPGADAPVDTVAPRGEGEVGTCTKVTCTPVGGRYCGTIGDNCGGKLECGLCPAGEECEGGRCVAGAGCAALSCQPTNGNYCGKVGDGCGRDMDCGACPAGQTCTSGVCTRGVGCVRLTCTTPSARYCGTVGDGCGGTLTCGDCAAGSTCGGGGVPGVCAPTNCTAVTCNPAGGGQYCGRIGNGCGGAIDCPACPGGMTCGGDGVPNACPGVPAGGACTGLSCAIDKCDGRPKTTVKGTVYDPAGAQPLYNVMVYVPNAPLDTLVDGATCQRCDATASGRPVAAALTDAAGNFTMQDVPVGRNIPVVVQTGKWRRQVQLTEVRPCQDNVFPGAEMFRLPRNQTEGHLPRIAMTRGKADSLECLMRRIGVADTEFTNPDGAGRVNIFYETGGGTGYASGTAFPPVATLFDPATIAKYDMVVMSCHGESARSRAQPTVEKQIVKDYVDRGGRVFGSHFSFSYFRGVAGTTDGRFYQPTPFPLVAEWDGSSDAPYTIQTGFPKGEAFADWLVTVGASPTRGVIDLSSVESPAMSLTPGLGQPWINASGSVPGIPYFSVPTPVESAATPDAQCGRFVHTGIHISGGENGGPFPTTCDQRILTPQEKALEFLLFDLSACALPDSQRPTAPIVPPPGAPNAPPPAVTTPPPPPPPLPPPPPPPIM